VSTVRLADTVATALLARLSRGVGAAEWAETGLKASRLLAVAGAGELVPS
jgi:hypothetical protein